MFNQYLEGLQQEYWGPEGTSKHFLFVECTIAWMIIYKRLTNNNMINFLVRGPNPLIRFQQHVFLNLLTRDIFLRYLIMAEFQRRTKTISYSYSIYVTIFQKSFTALMIKI